MNIAYIALGSNLGNREQILLRAVAAIGNIENTIVEVSSSVYETNPVGYTDQPNFLNMVIKVKTRKTPIELLISLQTIELEFGRKRNVKWGPRTLDLDILLYNQENIEADDLIIPHPRMWDRAFVLIPLMEIADSNDIPVKIDDNRLIELRSKEGVQLWKRKNGEGESVHIEN